MLYHQYNLPLKTRLRHAFWDAERRFSRWYWDLPSLRRRIVGWILLLSFLASVCFTVYGVYRGGVAMGRWVRSLFVSEQPAEPVEDPDLMVLDYYSGNYRHRQFPTGEKKPKRNVNLARDFNDVNAIQLEAARKLGIRPQPNREALAAMTDRMVLLEDTRYYKLDPMTQSVPYLVHDAADFLTALGQLWQSYHGTHSRFIITSCTRTDDDVRKLQRINVNATTDSAHRYGTTIDITYTRFDRRGRTTDIRLKADLSRALYDMQQAGHCYVKYEHNQACFHITVRPRN